MNLTDYLFMALKRLRARLFETIAIIIAIGLGTGVISIAIALRFSYLEQTRAMQENEYAKTIEIRAGEDYMHLEDVVRMGEKIAKPAEITLDVLYGIKENCSHVDYVFLRSGTSLQLAEVDKNLFKTQGTTDPQAEEELMQKQEKIREELYLQVQTTTPDEFRFRNLSLSQGSFFTNQDVNEGNRVIVLGAKAAERLIDMANPLGYKLDVFRQEPFIVIGVLEHLPETEGYQSWQNERINNGGYIPITATPFRTDNLTNLMDLNIHSFTAAVQDIDNLETAERQINSYLKERFYEGYNVSSQLSWQREMGQNVLRAQIIAAFAASLGLLIAAINILNLMLARVLRRTKEIGVITALGSTKKNIFNLFLGEAFLLGLLGALLGLAFALAGELIIKELLSGFPINIDIRVFLSGLAISGFVSLLFGVYPAMQASQINPVDALRTD